MVQAHTCRSLLSLHRWVLVTRTEPGQQEAVVGMGWGAKAAFLQGLWDMGLGRACHRGSSASLAGGGMVARQTRGRSPPTSED